jgi:hypothetical protein
MASKDKARRAGREKAIRLKDKLSKDLYEVSREFDHMGIKHFSLRHAANGNTLVLSEEGVRMRFASVL